MTSSWLLAVDPGLTTGWATVNLELGMSSVSAGQTPVDPFLDWTATLPLSSGLLIVERFTITQQTAKKSQQTDALEIIGVLKFLARRGGAQFELQTPAQAKKFCSDAQLRKLGLWKPGQDHARDALRHLVLGIVSHTSGQVRDELIQCLA
jgi:hypothetical protein